MPKSPPSSHRPQRLKRPGFTTIELLVVIGIIGLVAGIMVVGLPYAAAGLKKNQTETRLSQLRNAYSEIIKDKAGETRLFSIVLPGIYFTDNTGKPAQPPGSAENRNWVSVPASASESLYHSGKVYEQLRANPQFAAILNDLPTEKKRKINFTVPGKQVTTAAANNNTVVALEFPLDAWDNPILFVFDNLKRSAGVNNLVPLTYRDGTTEYATGGLTYLFSKAGTRFWKPQNVPLTPISSTYNLNNGVATPLAEAGVWTTWLTEAGINPTADAARDVQTNGIAFALRAPDRLPFFVSAGPDGRFETHDDNVYSFGN